MANITLTYSDRLQGWTSFFTFYPEWMIGLNNNFYTFKNGQIYKHRVDSVNRNTFYGGYKSSSITSVFNDAPTEAKMFKTIGLEATAPWEASIVTDMEGGQIQTDWYVRKEFDWYANIRRNDNNTDLDLMSAQGVGTCLAPTGAPPGAVTIKFGFDISNQMVNVGDSLYKITASPANLIGVISYISGNTIVVNAASSAPNAGDLILAIKDSVAESYGARGYYMEVQLTNSLTTQVEMFSMQSEAFKSYP